MITTANGALEGVRRVLLRPLYRRNGGRLFNTLCETFLESRNGERLVGKVDLIFTSPPFPLNRKKSYGNLAGQEYVDWLGALAPRLTRLLRPTGSIVLEIGNGWKKGSPEMSTLPLEALLNFRAAANLHLLQQFVCHNPARLPTPAQWVTIERTRVTDAFTHVWWMSPTPTPKADNRRVLRPYSKSMLKLLAKQTYNSGQRPSGHLVGRKSFLADNSGAIPSNVLSFANTRANDAYQEYCRSSKLEAHPARMQPELPDFFIKFLTEPGDIVFDPFAGSNTTGAAAACLCRKWVAVEAREEYALGSRGRFEEIKETSDEHQGVLQGSFDSGDTQ